MLVLDAEPSAAALEVRASGTSALPALSLRKGRLGKGEEAGVVRASNGRNRGQRPGQLVVRALEATSVILAQVAALGSGAPAIDVSVNHHGVDLCVLLAPRHSGERRCAVLLQEMRKIGHESKRWSRLADLLPDL